MSELNSSLTVNIDLRDGRFMGRVSVGQTDEIEGRPYTTWVWSRLKDITVDENKISGLAVDSLVHNTEGRLLSPEEAEALEEQADTEFPLSTRFTGELGEYDGWPSLQVEWTSTFKSTNLTQTDHCRLLRPPYGYQCHSP